MKATLEQIALDPKTIGVQGGMIVVATEIEKTEPVFWWSESWGIIWNLLPWSQLAIVMGVVGLSYTGFLFIRNLLKKLPPISTILNKDK